MAINVARASLLIGARAEREKVSAASLSPAGFAPMIARTRMPRFAGGLLATHCAVTSHAWAGTCKAEPSSGAGDRHTAALIAGHLMRAGNTGPSVDGSGAAYKT
jgi:hypothetical protein